MNNIERVRISIDRGGTFTDCFATYQQFNKETNQYESKSLVKKLLSSDPTNYKDAPTEGIRRLLESIFQRDITRQELLDLDMIESIRMGTTVATNALLERDGDRMGLLVTKGFKDLLEIGTQARPNLFDLTCSKPDLLYEKVIEIDERVTSLQQEFSDIETVNTGSGVPIQIEQLPNEESVKSQLKQLLDAGIRSVAVCLLHSYVYPQHEQMVGKWAEELGFDQISLSSNLLAMVKAVPRAHSACADAYLTPHLQRYIQGFATSFKGGYQALQKKLLFMQSDGGLSLGDDFSGYKAILSGPAAGVVGCAQTSYDRELGTPIIGFDMGGTSTDVCRYSGTYDHVFESTTAGVMIQAPQLDISTVAAGGGSKLSYQRGLFVVGPQSVGAHPGPVCYRKGGQLAVTDANLAMGRLVPEFFPHIFGPNEDQPLDEHATRQAFQTICDQIEQDTGKVMSVDDIAHGFIEVANEAMCRPIRQLTESKGWDTSSHALCSFGGAGGQHACAIASTLGVSTILIHRHASILSAYGLSLAQVVREVQEPFSTTLHSDHFSTIQNKIDLLKSKANTQLNNQGFMNSQIELKVYLNLRYQGTDCSLMVQLSNEDGLINSLDKFYENHQQQFGFLLKDRTVLVEDIRIRASGSPTNQLIESKTVFQEVNDLTPKLTSSQPAGVKKIYFHGQRIDTNLYFLKDLQVGEYVVGPALVIEPNSTLVIEPSWRALVTKDHLFITKQHQETKLNVVDKEDEVIELDPIKLSIFSNRFMSIAEQMGLTLQSTSVSTNIKERLDFSCALFGPDGGLIANAPHIPVHLGSLSFAVQWQLEHYRKLEEENPGSGLRDGDVIVTNHPAAGGSHLPDITVITPVFYGDEIIFFVASRGHHADIGGILPGSMPPHSQSLTEEGACILSYKLVDQGTFQTEGITKLLLHDPPRLHPDSSGTRCLKDNLSDLKAQVAANNKGIQLVKTLIDECGLKVVLKYMGFIRDNAELAVRSLLKKFVPNGQDNHVLKAVDYMDDGTMIQLSIDINNRGDAQFDFNGTGPQVLGNWNAPQAITYSAILYTLRCLVNESIPLNAGCLAPLNIKIPPNSLLSPSTTAAVVAGNVTTSQRITDTVLKAFSACAASQGCCNNLTFGKPPTTSEGDDGWGYYETIGGGSGAGPSWHGQSGVHVHMTNTRITDPEILERRYPVILREFALRKESGGDGLYSGGNGLIRTIEFHQPMKCSILSERRNLPPYGLNQGLPGLRGLNLWYQYDKDQYKKISIGGKATINVKKNDRVSILTPGGGGYGLKVE